MMELITTVEPTEVKLTEESYVERVKKRSAARVTGCHLEWLGAKHRESLASDGRYAAVVVSAGDFTFVRPVAGIFIASS